MIKRIFPFVNSIDGILEGESLVVFNNLSQLMAEKIDEPVLHMRGWVKS